MKRTLYKPVTLTVKPLYAIPTDKALHINGNKYVLRDFQARLYEVLREKKSEKLAIFLSAPTGSGKTFAILIPMAIEGYDGVIGVYPTKTLAKDQFDSVCNILGGADIPLSEIGIGRTIEELLLDDNMRREIEEKGLPRSTREFMVLRDVTIVNPDGKKLTKRVLLILITAETVEALRLMLGKKTKKEAFHELVNKIFLQVNFVVVFTVPEYPFLIHEMSYGEFEEEGEKLWRIAQNFKEFLEKLNANNTDLQQYIEELEEKVTAFYKKEFGVAKASLRELAEIYASLFRYPMFVDEFHAYSDLSELSLISLVFMYYVLYPQAKCIFSSATPSENLKKMISLVLNTLDVEEVSVEAGTSERGEREQLIRGKTSVTFYCISTGSSGVAGLLRAQKYVPEIAREIVGRDPDKKTIIILDRVGLVLDTCEHIYDAVKDLGKKLLYATSVKVPTEYCREAGLESLKKGDYDYIVGNMSLTQGLDLKHISRLIMYAKDRISFTQRFGRVPRGGDGEVHIVVDWSRLRVLDSLDGREMSYREFLDIVSKLYPSPSSISWLGTPIGFVKITLPIFAYIVLSAVAWGEEQRTELSRLRYALPKLADFIREYAKRYNISLDYVAKFISRLEPDGGRVPKETFYRLLSFRDVPAVELGVESSSGKFRKVLPFVVALRNFRFFHDKEVVIDIEDRSFYTPVLLVDELHEDYEEEVVKALKQYDNTVMSFNYLLGLLSQLNFALVQLDPDNRVRSRIELSRLKELGEVGAAPILIELRKGKDFDDYALFMATTRDAIPIGIRKKISGEHEVKFIAIAIFL